MRRFSVAVALLVAALGLAGCGEERRSEPLTGDPLELTPEVARGQVVFMTKCNECHPLGESGLAPALNDKPLPDFTIKAKVRGDLPGRMPSFDEREISDQDLEALVEYLDAVRDQGD